MDIALATSDIIRFREQLKLSETDWKTTTAQSHIIRFNWLRLTNRIHTSASSSSSSPSATGHRQSQDSFHIFHLFPFFLVSMATTKADIKMCCMPQNLILIWNCQGNPLGNTDSETESLSSNEIEHLNIQKANASELGNSEFSPSFHSLQMVKGGR